MTIIQEVIQNLISQIAPIILLLCIFLFLFVNATTNGGLGEIKGDWRNYLLIFIFGFTSSFMVTQESNQNNVEELESEINLLKSLNEDLNLDYFTLRKEHVYNKLQLEKTQKELELLKLNRNITIENAVLNKTIELNHELFRCYLELERANVGYYEK